MITIYHNPRCRKSREGLALVEASGQAFEIRKYLDETLSFEELSQLIDYLGISPINLVRKNEADWKTNFKGKNLNDKEIIQAMVDFPKLIERPILVKDKKAVVGRPPEKFSDLLS